MAFTADKQTLEDLNLTGKFRPGSIFSLFNTVVTDGGERLLEQLFRTPLTDVEAINARSARFRFFDKAALAFPVPRALFHQAALYLGNSYSGSFAGTLAAWGRRKVSAALLRDEQFAQLQEGLQATICALQLLQTFITQHPDIPQAPAMAKILDHAPLANLLATPGNSLLQTARYDHLLRNQLQNKMEALLDIVYELDVCIAVGNVARAKGFAYAHALPAGHTSLQLEGLRHPALEKAVANNLALDADCNLLFLTGANMAGKSTLMKSFGIAVYLAHMGFPVAATSMEFSVKDGLYSSINVADNLQQGYSHFYAEVLRVKTVATAVASGRHLVVIFDELFKGTNVKDAYDATLAVTRAFAAYRHCAFMISTHITEAGMALQEDHTHLQFSYLPTVMEGTVPRYTYRLSPGISSDRHGMMIITHERILELLH